MKRKFFIFRHANRENTEDNLKSFKQSGDTSLTTRLGTNNSLCLSCGYKIDREDKFCSFCGYEILSDHVLHFKQRYYVYQRSKTFLIDSLFMSFILSIICMIIASNLSRGSIPEIFFALAMFFFSIYLPPILLVGIVISLFGSYRNRKANIHNLNFT